MMQELQVCFFGGCPSKNSGRTCAISTLKANWNFPDISPSTHFLLVFVGWIMGNRILSEFFVIPTKD